MGTGQPFRTLTVLDVCTRECLALEAETSFPATRVVEVLDQVVAVRGPPRVVTVDNGTEFTSRAFEAWATAHQVKIDFIRPGRPVENAFIESFNGRFREECLNQHFFRDLAEVREILAAWRTDYNEVRPHSSLADLAPLDYASRVLGVRMAV